MLGGLRDQARHPRQYFGWPRRAKRGRPITHKWIDLWTLLLPGQHRWAQVGATDEPREFRLAGSRQDKRLERAIPLTTHLWTSALLSIGAWQVRIADCSIVYRLIAEGVPLWAYRRNLHVQQLEMVSCPFHLWFAHNIYPPSNQTRQKLDRIIFQRKIQL